MKRIVRCCIGFCLSPILGVIVTLAQPITFAQTAGELAPCVVYLQIPKVKTIQLDSVEYEIFIKNPRESTPKPYVDTVRGTGFFVVRYNSLYLVTPNHLAQQMSANAMMTIQTRDDRPLRFSMSDFLGKDPILNWTSSQEADIAVLRLFPSPQMFGSLRDHFLPFEVLLTNEEAPPRERTLAVIGFPLALGVTERFSPVSIESKASSGLLELPRADNGEVSIFFLLDNPTAGGFVGAPVFELPAPYPSAPTHGVSGRRFTCVGLVHATVTDDTGNEFAAVVPSPYIVQAILGASR